MNFECETLLGHLTHKSNAIFTPVPISNKQNGNEGKKLYRPWI